MSVPRSGLNPEANTWGPQSFNPGASNANTTSNPNTNTAAQSASSQGANHQVPPSQPESSDSRQGAGAGRGTSSRRRGRGGRLNPQQGRPVPQPTQQPVQQRGQQPEHGRGSRGGRGGVRGGGPAIDRQVIALRRSELGHGQRGPRPLEGVTHEERLQQSRNARRRAARGAINATRPRDADAEAKAESAAGPKVPPSTAPDLATRMHEDIDSGNYDCPICLSVLTRNSKIWACSVCYHATHYSCVSSWVKQATNQGTPLEKVRCPACNMESSAVPVATGKENEDKYKNKNKNSDGGGGFFDRTLCWCGKQKTPAVAPAVLPPHSCGRVCNRQYPDCHHACNETCHAGPCPPCTGTGPLVMCFCGKETSIKTCAAGVQKSWSCGTPCNNTLACRTHKCQRTCHPDDCGTCTVSMPSTCFCGKEQQDMACKDREPAQISANYGQLVYGTGKSSFEGVFRCDTVCGRVFDCGKHFCKKSCHAQDARPPHCPTSPDVITHCLCGKTLLASASGDDANSVRTSCEDPIPACDKICAKVLDCGHTCPETCHAGACPPCPQIVDASCACGQMSSPVVCSDRAARDNVQCEIVCRSWLSCKQHRCNIVCCPGKPKAAARLKPRRRATVQGSAAAAAQDEIEAEHTCLRSCGRLLKCGKHACPQVCHKGACYSCVAYILEDMSCPCGQTVVEAPFLCGTALPACDADCPRPLPCGHPPIPHRCHDNQQQPCPRCQRLVSKSCLCGKLVLNRVACGADNIQCSNVCGKTLNCGVHTCRLPCHAEGKCEEATEGTHEAATCSQVCGRPKATCGHPCANPCHGADDPCSEDEPCGAAIEVACPCQRQTRKVRCNVSAADPTPAYRRPECDDECLRIQRNAQLKDALRISDDYKDEHLVYSTAIMEYFMANRAFATAQEEKIRAFFGSVPSTPTPNGESSSIAGGADKACIFKPMKRHERQFLHLLAESFNLRSEGRDEEPYRYVFLGRPRTGTPAVPNISLAESEEIYLRLRNKAKAEADEREAEAALAASLKAKEAVQEASREDMVASRTERQRPFNAIFVPSTLAATMTANSRGDTNTILDNDAFQTIVEAWHQQQQDQKRWAPSPGFGSSSSSSSSIVTATMAATLNQHMIQPSGDVVLRVLVPAAAPAVVEQLLVFLLAYMNAWWADDAAGTDENQFALCHVDAQYNILRLGRKTTNSGSPDWDDDQWNIVAGTSSASRRESASATPVDGGVGTANSAPQPPLSTKRVIFKLRQKQKTATMTTAAAEAERKRWMAILAQQATEEEEEEEEHPDEDDHEEEEEGPEELRAALEQAFLTEEGEGVASAA